MNILPRACLLEWIVFYPIFLVLVPYNISLWKFCIWLCFFSWHAFLHQTLSFKIIFKVKVWCSNCLVWLIQSYVSSTFLFLSMSNSMTTGILFMVINLFLKIQNFINLSWFLSDQIKLNFKYSWLWNKMRSFLNIK